MKKDKLNNSEVSVSGVAEVSGDANLRKIPLWRKICAALLGILCIFWVCKMAGYADDEIVKFDQILRLTVSQLVSNEQLIGAGIEAWPSIKEIVGYGAATMLIGNTAVISLIILLIADDCTKSLRAENAKLKTAIEAQNAKLDKITELIKLSEFLSDDKSASTLDEILEEVVTTRRMMEESVERDGYFDSDAADFPSATDD